MLSTKSHNLGWIIPHLEEGIWVQEKFADTKEAIWKTNQCPKDDTDNQGKSTTIPAIKLVLTVSIDVYLNSWSIPSYICDIFYLKPNEIDAINKITKPIINWGMYN